MIRAFSLVLVAVTMLCSTNALAQKPDNITAAEMALLPRYCPDTNTFGYGGEGSNPSPNSPKWVAMMGRGFWAMHHYCWALIKLWRVEKPGLPAYIQRGNREAALGDLIYVVQNSPSDFIMLPEIYTKMGEVQILLAKYPDASRSFETARSIKPDYWPAYFHWAEFLRKQGKKNEARQLVEEGLANSPGAKPLEGLLVALGGNPASIRPKRAAAANKEPTSQ
jgi:tetratricopeptide (TPR) repeat protein